MALLRIICVDSDHGAAANIGGPVDTKHKTFEVDCPADLAAFLDDERSYRVRFIEAVEFCSDRRET